MYKSLNKNEWYSIMRRKYFLLSTLMFLWFDIYKNEWYSIRRRKLVILNHQLHNSILFIRMNDTPQGDGNLTTVFWAISSKFLYKNKWYSVRRRKLPSFVTIFSLFIKHTNEWYSVRRRIISLKFILYVKL